MQGSIYNNKGRYWWRVKLPGQSKYQHVALKPEGARFATKDKTVAVEDTGRIWLYRPANHKTAYRGHKRVIYIGPKAQKVLKPFLERKAGDYCFTPAESYQKTKLSRSCYNRNTYRQMINHAIKKANRDKKEIPLLSI